MTDPESEGYGIGVPPATQLYVDKKVEALFQKLEAERKERTGQRVKILLGVLAFLGAIAATTLFLTYNALEKSISDSVVANLKETWLAAQDEQTDNDLREARLDLLERVRESSQRLEIRMNELNETISALPITVENRVRETLFGELEKDMTRLRHELTRNRGYAALTAMVSDLKNADSRGELRTNEVDKAATAFFGFFEDTEDAAFLQSQTNYATLARELSTLLFRTSDVERLSYLFAVADDAIVTDPVAVDNLLSLYSRRLLAQAVPSRWDNQLVEDFFKLGQAARDLRFPEYPIPLEMLIYYSIDNIGHASDIARLFQEAKNLSPETGDEERAFIVGRLIRYSSAEMLVTGAVGREQRVIAERGREFMKAYQKEIKQMMCIGETIEWLEKRLMNEGVTEPGLFVPGGLDCSRI